MYLQINMVKYNADREITNTYENLQIVWSQFFTDKLIFIYFQFNSNFYWFISIRIWLVRWMANRYSVLLKFLVYLNSHSVFKFKGKIKFIAVTYSEPEVGSVGPRETGWADFRLETTFGHFLAENFEHFLAANFEHFVGGFR